ncbi:hypothetical protein LTR60_000714, partial [Cryomyces antarcticus]
MRLEVDEIGYAVAELADLGEKAAQAGLSRPVDGAEARPAVCTSERLPALEEREPPS